MYELQVLKGFFQGSIISITYSNWS